MNLLKQLLVGIWQVLTWSRIAFFNLIWLGILIALVAVFMHEEQIRVEPKSLLVMDLSGSIVEKNDMSSGVLSTLVTGGEPAIVLSDVLRALTLAQTDPNISGILMRVGELGPTGLASIREIGAQMDQFKTSGKPITVWATSLTQGQYAIASHASEVYLHPMGQVFLKGLSTSRLYWGELLDKLGVTVHVFKAGDFKTAPEPFTRSGPSMASLKADQMWVDDAWRQLTTGMETARGLMPGSIDQYIAQLPQKLARAQGDMSAVAMAENLIDGVAMSDEINDLLLERQEGVPGVDALKTIDFFEYLALNPEPLPMGPHVAVLLIEGEIKEGLDAPGMTGSRSTVELIRQAKNDPNIAALVVRVNSPGGSAVASEVIRRELELVKNAGKPVVVSMGNVAASGGYWIAMAGNRIIANPMTITGSIGVFGMLPTFEGVRQEFGVGQGGYATSALANAENLGEAMTPEFSKIMQLSVARTYADFTMLVAQARNLELKQVQQLAQGLVYTGEQALKYGLVDQLGSAHDAVQLAAEMASVPVAAGVEVLSPPMPLLDRWLAQWMAKVKVVMPSTMISEWLSGSSESVLTQAERMQKLVTQAGTPLAHCLCTPL